MTNERVVAGPAGEESQRLFRLAMDALARPGKGVVFGPVRPSPFGPASHGFALLRVLADREVSIALYGSDPEGVRLAGDETGSRVVGLNEADYVFATSDPGATASELKRGLPETPEDGATLVVSVDSVAGGDLVLGLRGPGIDGERVVRVAGISTALIDARNGACAAYPLGIDLFLVDREGACVGLPRTTVVRIEEG